MSSDLHMSPVCAHVHTLIDEHTDAKYVIEQESCALIFQLW